jgi:hypothetical protein
MASSDHDVAEKRCMQILSLIETSRLGKVHFGLTGSVPLIPGTAASARRGRRRSGRFIFVVLSEAGAFRNDGWGGRRKGLITYH